MHKRGTEGTGTMRPPRGRRMRGTWGWLVLVVAAWMGHAAPLGAVEAVAESAGDFVYVQDGRLMYRGRPFFFSGANSYSMLYGKEEAAEQFRIARSLGIGVWRIWGFWNLPCRGAGDARCGDGAVQTDPFGRPVLQSAPGRFVEAGFRNLDFVIALAHRYDMKLIVVLLNEWAEFGGIETYLQWAGLPIPPFPSGHYALEDFLKPYRARFWRHDRAKQLYFDYVSYVLHRVNAITGVAYKDDPAIMAWEIINEPRFGPWNGDPTGTAVRDWLAEAAAYIKSIDPRHLVSTGEEGFLRAGEGGVERRTYPWTAAGGEGVDFVRNARIPEVDLLTFHCWPFQWNLWESSGEDLGADQVGEYPDIAAFCPEWIAAHAALARQVGKPVYLGEFGLQILRREGSDLSHRDAVVRAAYRAVLRSGIAGAALWHLTASHDAASAVYTGPVRRKTLLQAVYDDDVVPHDEAFRFDVFCPEDETTCSIVRAFGEAVAERMRTGRAPVDAVDAAPCLFPWTACGGSCALLDADPAHCGACDAACSWTEQCRDGRCVPLPAADVADPGAESAGAGCGTAPRADRRAWWAAVL